MQNLINFLWRYSNTFLFLALELVALLLLVSYNSHHSVRFLSWTGDVSGSMFSAVTNFKEYVNLKETNEKLAAENAWLKSRLENAYLYSDMAFHPLVDTIYQQEYDFTSAKVINNTVDLTDNFIIIDKGRNNGVEPGMGVLGIDGIVGVVKDVSSSYAVIMSVLHKDFRHSAELKKSGYFGELSWKQEGAEWATLDDIPSHVTLQQGDTLISRGGGLFPKGQMVGFVDSWEQPEGSNFYQIKVRLSTDFRKIGFVYVIKNLKQQELKELIESQKDD